MEELHIVGVQFCIFISHAIGIRPGFHAGETLHAQLVETGLEASQFLVGIEPPLVPMLCHAVVDGKARTVVALIVDIAAGSVVVGIGKDANEGIVGILLCAYLTEAILVCMRRNYHFTIIGEVSSLLVVCAVATHFCLHHNCSVSRNESGEVVLFFTIVKVLEPADDTLVAIETIAQRAAFKFKVSNTLCLSAIQAETVGDDGVVVTECIFVLALNA